MVGSAPAAAGDARAAYERLDLKRREIVVEPRIVVEIAFDTLERVAETYAEMLAREGVSETP